MSTFIFGLPPSITDSAMLSNADAFQAVGNNTGNLAFCHAINRQLGGGQPVYSWSHNIDSLNAQGGIGVMTLANQLGAHANYGHFGQRIQHLNCKLVGVGLGAQAPLGAQDVDIPVGSLDWVRAIQNHSPSDAPNLGLRGEFTRQALARYGLADKTVVTGCPTLFISEDPQLGQTIAKRWTGKPVNVAVAAGAPSWRHMAKLEASLTALLSTAPGNYICQSPAPMVTLGRGLKCDLDDVEMERCRAYMMPHLDKTHFKRWARNHAVSFFSASAWMEHLLRFDFVIGTRIHGVMFALQMGIPAVCITHDSRTLELCETMKVPFVPASQILGGISRDQLGDLFQFSAEAFDDNRRMLAGRYIQFMRANGIELAPYMHTLAA